MTCLSGSYASSRFLIDERPRTAHFLGIEDIIVTAFRGNRC